MQELFTLLQTTGPIFALVLFIWGLKQQWWVMRSRDYAERQIKYFTPLPRPCAHEHTDPVRGPRFDRVPGLKCWRCGHIEWADRSRSKGVGKP